MAKAKSRNRRDEHPDPASLKSGIFSEERLPIILASIENVVWSIDAETYETLYLNAAAERIYGRTASAFYADPKLFMNIVHPEDLSRVAQMPRELINKGVMTVQYRIIRPDGEVRWLEDNIAIARGADGRPERFDGIATDVTEARLAQTMLEEREARLRSILETAPDPIITIDKLGIVQSFSSAAEKLFGYAPGEIIGRNVKILMPAPHREKHDDYMARYLMTGEKHIIGIGRQVEAQRKDGTVFPIELAIGEVKLGGTRIFTGFIRDLTARVKMEQELRQVQKMEAIGQLTGGVAHDFNNLLTVISLNLEMLERELTDGNQRELLNDAQEATKLGGELTKRLLAFGRRQSLNPKPTDLNALAADMAALLRRSLGESVETTISLSEQLPLVMVDTGQIQNALLNLAINARDAMPNGGQLIIKTNRVEIDSESAAAYADLAPGRYVTLAVTDTGTGMTQEVCQRAFEPFYTTKEVGVGTGLGLSMVYGFVKQSGGHVRIYSEVGHGTTVRLYLPEYGSDTQAMVQPAPAQEKPAFYGRVVLVVEDNRHVRRVSVRRLKELGFAVIEAESGLAALNVLDRGDPIDVLFTDVIMPGGITGIDLAHEARQRRPGLKVLFTSGYAEPAAVKGSLLTTNVDWLSKPYSINDLDNKLRALLSRSRRAKANQN